MTIPYAFIDPQLPEEHVETQKVDQLVQYHFAELYNQTSISMKKILKRIIVRTMWDSYTKDKYGEYYGVPAPRETPYDTGTLPPEIVLFARPLSRDFSSESALNKKVRMVLIHEIGHHLGLSEDELRKRNIV